jgi:DNA polymerase-3 subunit alpha
MMDEKELENYMKISEEDLQKAFHNILNIKNICEDYSLEKPLKIPQLPWKSFSEVFNAKFWFDKIPYLEKFYNSDYIGDKELFKAIVNRIMTDKTLQNEETYLELNENLKSTWISSEVNNTHWSSYFLNLQKIIDACWEAGSLVGPGRGSGAGFLLLYVLGITQINPLREETKCFGWRFLNPERVSVLDIDTDIESGRRGQVLEHLRKVYGYDRVAGVATFGTEKAKSAILTAARGLGIDVDIAQYLSSMIESDRGQQRTLNQTFYGDEDKGFYANKQFVFEMIENYPELWAVAQKIEGLVCRMGVHAGGVIFVDEPFTNSAALMRAPDGTIITQFELHDAEELS